MAIYQPPILPGRASTTSPARQCRHLWFWVPIGLPAHRPSRRTIPSTFPLEKTKAAASALPRMKMIEPLAVTAALSCLHKVAITEEPEIRAVQQGPKCRRRREPRVGKRGLGSGQGGVPAGAGEWCDMYGSYRGDAERQAQSDHANHIYVIDINHIPVWRAVNTNT